MKWSNIGTKVTTTIYKYQVGQHSGNNYVAIPPHSDLDGKTTEYLWTYIGDLTGLDPTLTLVGNYNEVVGAYNYYDGVDFIGVANLSPENMALIKPGKTIPLMLCGWYDKTPTPIDLYASEQGHSGQNWVSLPYNAKSKTSVTLWQELTDKGCTPNEIDKPDEVTGGLLTYDGVFGLEEFSVVDGVAILLKVGATSTWTPEVY